MSNDSYSQGGDDHDKLTQVVQHLFDIDVVMDWPNEYGEPGYTASGPILIGSWWCNRRGEICRDADGNELTSVHSVEVHYPAEFAYLESIDAEMEWYDEWIVDHESGKCYRTQPDSYSWQPSYVMTEHGDLLTPDADADQWIEWAADEHEREHRAIPNDMVSDHDLSLRGFELHPSDRYHDQFESGWYGTDNSPADVAAAITREHGDDVELLFKLAGVEQFRTMWTAWYRLPGWDDDADDTAEG